MVSGAVIAIVCLPALLTLVWLRSWRAALPCAMGTSSVVTPGALSHRTTLFQPITREWEYFPPSKTFAQLTE
jgi:hypothetical protein